MIRSFLALSLPEEVQDALGDLQIRVRNANWISEENLHLTLVFLGDCDRRQLADLDAALAAIAMPPFELTLSGTAAFGGEKPHLLYAALEESEPLRRLQAKTERCAVEVGIPIPRRKFRPHVTLARCGGGVIPAQALDWTVRNNLFRHGPIPVGGFGLFRSDLGNGPPVYTELMHYPLREAGASPATLRG